ncbi:hypothetical protein OROMI_031052 [Orobanche minor]
MADQNSNIDDHQQFIDAITSAEQLLMFDENHDDNHHPLLDNFVDDILQEPNGNYGSHFSGTRLEEINSDEHMNFTDFPQNSAFGNPIQIPMWPVPPSPHSCTCCQTLREFYHTNGTQVLKLDVHGRLGLISHAVLERYNSNYVSSESHEYHMFDFCQESISRVKQFLVQYCNDRKREGYVLLQDPLSNFYDALCIGLNGDDSSEANIFPPQTSGGDMHMNQEDGLNQPEEDGMGVTKSYLASQRERTGKMKLSDLAGYFHLPINAASNEMKICPSALKNICRKEGLSRWPYRKIKSIEGKIKKKQSLNSSDANERARAEVEIQELQKGLAKFYGAYVS